MDKKELEILIDKSVLGSITAKEKSKLDEYIMNNPTTKQEINMRKDILKGFEYNADKELKTVLEKIHQEEILGNAKRKSYTMIAIVLLSIILISGSIFLFNTFSTSNTPVEQDTREIYASYYKPMAASLETRNVESSANKVVILFIENYKARNYQQALETIRPVIENSANNILLFAGICGMETGALEEGISYFDRIINTEDYYYTDHAKWYKALTYLKKEDLTNARNLFEELANDPKADHHKEAIEILKKL